MNNTFYDEEAEVEIDLRELFFALKKKFFIILAVGLLGGCIGCAYTRYLKSPVYTSTASMLVLNKETSLTSLSDLQLGSQLTKDCEVLITSRKVMEDVIQKLDLNMTYSDLESRISIQNPSDARILEISVDYHDPVMAKTIVNELALTASEFIGEKMEVIPPKIIEEGEIPTAKSGPNMRKNALAGMAAGILLCAGLVSLLTIMDDTIKTEEDVERYLGVPTLASIPDRKDYISGKKRTAKKKKKKSSKRERGQEGK